MPTTADAAQDLLGAGFAPRPRLFTPVDLGGGLSAADKYRHLTQMVQEENAARKMLAEGALTENSYLLAERSNQAMRREADVLSELNKLDPLAEGFENVASQFSQFASVSPAVERALNLKMQQRSGYNQALGQLAQSGIEAGLDEETFSSQQQTAMEMLRRGDLAGYRSLLARSQRLAKSQAESDELRMLRKQGKVRNKLGLKGLQDELELREDYAIRGENRSAKQSIQTERQKAMIRSAEKRSEAIRDFRGKMADIEAKLPSSLITDNTELSEGYSVAQWIADPFGAPESFAQEPTVFSYEGHENGDFTLGDMVEAGISENDAIALTMGQSDPIVVPNALKAEEIIANRVVDQQVREFLVGDGPSPRITGFSGLEKLVEDLPEEEVEAVVGELVDEITMGALTLKRDAFVAAFTKDRSALESAVSEEAKESVFELFAALDGLGLTPSSNAAKFAGGLFDSVAAVREMAAEKKKFRFQHPDIELMGATLDAARVGAAEEPKEGASFDEWAKRAQAQGQ